MRFGERLERAPASHPGIASRARDKNFAAAPVSTPHCLHHGDKVERMGLMRSAKCKFCARRLLIGMLLLSGHFRSGMSDELPIATGRTASPESQGLDSTVLAEALEYVRSQRLPLHSLLIVRNSIMVLEAYFWPYQGDEIHDVASVTKSFTSAAVGIELERCLVRGVDE